MQNKKFKRLGNKERESISRGLAQRGLYEKLPEKLVDHQAQCPEKSNGTVGRQRVLSIFCESSSKHSGHIEKKRKKQSSESKGITTICFAKAERRMVSARNIWTAQKGVCLGYDNAISHEAIYQYIYVLPRGELKQTLIKALRQEHKYRRTQKAQKPEENRGKIANMLSIEERPAEVADRSVPGHWEGDLILGKYKRSAPVSYTHLTLPTN